MGKGYNHVLKIQRPPADMVGRKPNAKKIEDYPGYLMGAQQQVIERNNTDMQKIIDASK